MAFLNSKSVQQTIAPTKSVATEWTDTDRRLMRRALALAANGVAQVSPGPLVGCVIANDRGEVFGEGFYVYEKLKHAETYALEQAGTRSRGAIAYVSLEPHAHQGRTPPCTDALIRAGIKRVVVPIEDPNPKVCGRGFDHLRAAGVDVRIGLMSDEASRLNEKYLHFMRTGRPFVHLKLAASLDGKIATRTGESRWITGVEARERVHELRHEYDAILIGSGTATADDPLLTDRSGKRRRVPLVRIVLDENLKLSSGSQLTATAHDFPLLIIGGSSVERSKVDAIELRGAEVIRDSANGRDLQSVLEMLGRRSIQSVLVEGGSGVAAKFIEAGLVNKVSFFIAPMIIGGREAPGAVGGDGFASLSQALRLDLVEVTRRGRDIEVTGYARKKDEG